MFLTRDLVGGIGTMALGAAYLFYALQIRQSALDDTVGPAGMPRAYGLIMIGLGLAIAAGSVIKTLRARRTGLSLPSEWSGMGRKIIWAAGLLAIGVVYLLIVSFVGYIVGIAILITATALYQGAGLNWRVFAIAVAGAVGLWLIFVLLLGVSMPQGKLLPF